MCEYVPRPNLDDAKVVGNMHVDARPSSNVEATEAEDDFPFRTNIDSNHQRLPFDDGPKRPCEARTKSTMMNDVAVVVAVAVVVVVDDGVPPTG